MAYTVQRPTAAGAALSYAAGQSSDTFKNSGVETVHVKNASGAPVTVTLVAPNACSFGVVNSAHNVAVVVPAGSDRWIGPFNTGRFNDSNGDATLELSATASVTVAIQGR